VLARGFAVVEDRAGALVAGAADARAARALRVRFADGTVDATVDRGDG
jgi:exodeoxyribonuclease VII large subunit